MDGLYWKTLLKWMIWGHLPFLPQSIEVEKYPTWFRNLKEGYRGPIYWGFLQLMVGFPNKPMGFAYTKSSFWGVKWGENPPFKETPILQKKQPQVDGFIFNQLTHALTFGGAPYITPFKPSTPSHHFSHLQGIFGIRAWLIPMAQRPPGPLRPLKEPFGGSRRSTKKLHDMLTNRIHVWYIYLYSP